MKIFTGTVVKPPQVRSAKRYLTRVTANGNYVVKWPRSWKKWIASQEFNRDQMRVAAYLAATPHFLDMATALNWSKGSNDTWKDVLFRAMFGTLFYVIAPDGTVATPFNHRYYPPITPTGDDVPWTLINDWEFTVDGVTNAINITGLAAYHELFISMNAVGCSSSAFRQVLCSTDNGATYFSSSGNYEAIQSNGVPSVQSAMFLSVTQSTAVLSAQTYIPFINIGAKYACACPQDGGAWAYRFVANNDPVTAIRIRPSAGNFNSGRIGTFAR